MKQWARFHFSWPLVLIAAWFVQVVVVQRLPADHWFEDDPNLIAYIIEWSNPIDYVINPEAIRALHGSRVLTPLQPLLFWLDYTLAPLSSKWAYIHGALWLLAVMLAAWYVLRPWLTGFGATVLVIIWSVLPSTIAVSEFLSARHYLGGLLFLFIAMFAAERRVRSKGIHAVAWLALCMFCFAMSLLGKELFWLAGFWILASRLFAERDFIGLSAVTLLAAVYPFYRIWTLGTLVSGVDSTQASLAALPDFAMRWPDLIAPYNAGWALLILICVLIWTSIRRQTLAPKEILFWVGLAVSSLVIVVPVLPPLLAPEASITWPRVLLLWHGVVLAFCVRLAVLSPISGKSWEAALMIVGAWLLLPAVQTAHVWDSVKRPYEHHAEFYRNHPERLLLVDLQGKMFMRGIHGLYSRGQARHFIDIDDTGPAVVDVLRRYDSAWKMDEFGAFGRVSYGTVWSHALANRKPLLQLLPVNEVALQPWTRAAPEFQGDRVRWRPLRYVPERVMVSAPVQLKNRHVFLLPPGFGETPRLISSRGTSVAIRQAAVGEQAPREANVTIRSDFLRTDLPFKTNSDLPLGFIAGSPEPVQLAVASSEKSRLSWLHLAVPELESGKVFTLPHLPKDRESWRFGLLVLNSGDAVSELACIWADAENKWRFDENLKLEAGAMKHFVLSEKLPTDDAFGLIRPLSEHLHVLFYLSETGRFAEAVTMPVPIHDPGLDYPLAKPLAGTALLVLRQLDTEAGFLKLQSADSRTSRSASARELLFWPVEGQPETISGDVSHAAWWFYRAEWGAWQLTPSSPWVAKRESP